MGLKECIDKAATARIRSVAKSDAIYDAAGEAEKADSAMTAANKSKDNKGFEKAKKDCLGSVADGEKAIKPWETEMAAWEDAIKALETEIAAEKTKVEQLQRENDAVGKAIDEINKDIKAYNDDLLLGERDPRARPLVVKPSGGAKILTALAVAAAAQVHATKERETLSNQRTWVGKPIDKLKEVKGRASKAKFTPGK